MVQKALHGTLRDLNDSEKIFWCAILLLSGDFRQTFLVIPSCTFSHEINACLKLSSLWREVETRRLTINMGVSFPDDHSDQKFSNKLLDIGNGEAELHFNK
ncbi:ATP-dependent DNA helicase [Trichonephila clavipes]|nr:ATP-dependent DNA helicase [Trichonephila clavipes]